MTKTAHYNPEASSSAPRAGHNETSSRYFEHSSAQRISTDTVVVESIRKEYPELHLTVSPSRTCNILAYAAAGHAGIAPIDKANERLSWRSYYSPANRLNGNGTLADSVKLGKYLLDWKNKEFVVYIIEGRDGSMPYGVTSNQYILSSAIEATNTLLLEVGQWSNSLHGEVWVFDGGYWQKSKELYDSAIKSSWEDVILAPDMKKAIRDDVENFFDSRATYEKLKVPWKRGEIFWGPPGNGKTISVKAIMHTLYSRKDPIPTLYVRSLSSFGGPEYSVSEIFAQARQEAPCLLVFEDLDSMITDNVRSYFLNEVDGIRKNDGILIIGSTNHLDRLDPGIAKRPSRFDRKFLFPNPNEKEREAYIKYWQGKLKDNKDLEFPNKICPAVAKITEDFSFAFLQEAMIASLLAIAREDNELVCVECLEQHGKSIENASCDRKIARPFKGLFEYVWSVKLMDDEDPSLNDFPLWRQLKKQIRILREEMSDEKGTTK
ncbi:uncharacterized protein RCC_01489 [Ramularia collo-cygni]|uniref:AAA+ ATPase domain-containing protein n=1 Tax=Ramularia collo-cygni TaxID=112498 RepID=A0A2D3ULW8_9PEZI|nr:uncharacterized protein RCC_01489 [Ramularia collo-cygni]CZT15652.1 uncharacterized protein RCC_01489 [Ramularia collo-cygni]